MEYVFGPNKLKFNGTHEEWNKLKEEIAWCNEETSKFPIVKIICPHCGAKNTHIIDSTNANNHIECDLIIDKKGKKIYYECPGYYLCRYINSPR